MATFKKAAQVGSCVSCPMCSREIALVGELRLPEEFSVLCPNCGRRKVYRSTAVHDQKQDGQATDRTIALRPFQ